MGRKEGVCCTPVVGGGAGSPSNTTWPGLRSNSIPSGIFVYPAVWPQYTWAENWGRAPFRGELGPDLTQRRWSEAYHRTKCHLDPSSRLATTDIAENWGVCPLLGRGAGSPSNTMSIGLGPTSLPSGILIHPAIWPQQIWAKNWGLCPLLRRGSWVPI